MGRFIFMVSQDLAGLLLTLAGQSILVSLIGIALVKLLSRRSAPVRSLFCCATLVSMGLIVVASLGFRLSGISWNQTLLQIFLVEKTENTRLSPRMGNVYQLPFESVHSPSENQPPLQDKNDRIDPRRVTTLYSRCSAVPVSFFINLIGTIWLGGILFQFIRLCYGILLINTFRKKLQNTRDALLSSILHSIAFRFQNSRLPGLYSSPQIESPITIGVFNPIVIIPEKLLTSLNEDELKSILLHELSHIYHHDQIIGLIKRIVIAFHWWNPLVYMINREHEQAREEVSDNYVLHELHPKIYTKCLLNIAEKVCLIGSYPTAAGMAGRRFDLKKRVEQILSKKRVVAIQTRLFLKAIALSSCLVLTFFIAGLHACIKIELFSGTVEDSQKTHSALIIETEGTSSPGKKTQTVSIFESVPSNVIVIPNSQTILQPESETPSFDIYAQENSAIKKDSFSAQSSEKSALKDNVTGDTSRSPENALWKDASDTAGYISLGISSLKNGDLENAVHHFSLALNLDPANAVAYAARGSAFFRLNLFGNAISDFTRAIEINPHFAVAYQNRGSVYYRQGRFDDALSDYNSAIEKDPEISASYQDRGSIFNIQGRYNDAISDFSRALEISPDDAITYSFRGKAYFSLEKYQKAIDDFNKAVDLDPRYINAYIFRGFYYQTIGEPGKASADYSKALELSSDKAAENLATYIPSIPEDWAENTSTAERKKTDRGDTPNETSIVNSNSFAKNERDFTSQIEQRLISKLMPFSGIPFPGKSSLPFRRAMPNLSSTFRPPFPANIGPLFKPVTR